VPPVGVKNKYYRYEYALKDHLGNLRVACRCGEQPNPASPAESYAPVAVQTIQYDPWGLQLPTLSETTTAGPVNRYTYNGKEEQGDLGLLDYGARLYDPSIGRWNGVDGFAEKYFDQSTFTYVHNTPINAVDPDGRLVIFVNGQHDNTPGEVYWGRDAGYFNEAVMNRLKDHNDIYYDGAIGGWANTNRVDMHSYGTPLGTFVSMSAHRPNNQFAEDRYRVGFNTGKQDAEKIISKLARDSHGNITETIKIITHSMGGVFGSGLLAGIKAYLKKHPDLEKQVRFNLVAHFDSYQADFMTGDPDVPTFQFINKAGYSKNGEPKKQSDKYGWLANEEMRGNVNRRTNDDEGAHGIQYFWGNINSLPTGSYVWNGSQWVPKQ
jgi:RHS repeat-associated protein